MPDVGISSEGDYEDRLSHLPSAQRVASLYGYLQMADPKYDEKDYLFNMHRPADAQVFYHHNLIILLLRRLCTCLPWAYP